MFARQAGYLALVREHGFALPEEYDDVRAAWDRVRRGARRRAAATVPCNNDLLAANFIDDGERVWLIDYEYSGNNDPAFELGNTATECDFTREQVDELVSAWWAAGEPSTTATGTSGAASRPSGPASTCSRCARSTAGRCGGSSRPPPARSTTTSTAGAWSASRRRPAGSRSDGFDALLDRVATGGCAVTDLPTRARVVIVGGGVIGCSMAYHLTQLGWTDVLLLEQGTLSCGTTWHAAGLVGLLRASESGTRLVQYSAELYAGLEAETGLSTGYRQCGGLIVARTEDRMVQLRRTAATAAAYDLECELLTPAQAQERLAGHRDRRPARGDLAAAGRPGQPDRPDPVAGEGRPDPRGAGARAGPGAGRRDHRVREGPARDRRPHRPR